MVSGMITAGGIQLLGHAPGCLSSEFRPELHQVRVMAGLEEATRRHVGWRGQFADGHGGLVAGVAPGTVRTVLRHFVAEDLTFGDAEVEVFEEGGDAGEETDAADAAGFGLIEEGADEQAAGSVSLGVGADDDGADLGEVRAVDVERGAADELAGGRFDDGEGVNVCADLSVAPGEQGAIVGEAVDELMDGAGILQLRSTRSQGGRAAVLFSDGMGGVARGGQGRGPEVQLYEGHCHMSLRFSSSPLRWSGAGGLGLRLRFERERRASCRSCGLRWRAPRGSGRRCAGRSCCRRCSARDFRLR